MATTNLHGTVYLVHLDTPLGEAQSDEQRALLWGLPPRKGGGKVHAQHYLGWALNLEGRIYMHRIGRGAKFLRAANRAGIAWQVVRTWEGGKDLERKLKRSHHAARFCPICKGQHEI